MNAARLAARWWGTDQEKAAAAAGIPLGLANRLEGKSPEELGADARALAEGLDGWGENHEPEPVRRWPNLDGGVKGASAPPPGPSMNTVLRAHLFAARRRPTDDDFRHAVDELS